MIRQRRRRRRRPSETVENGEAPPEERREGGAKPPKTLTDLDKEGRERCDRAREKVEEEGGKRPCKRKSHVTTDQERSILWEVGVPDSYIGFLMERWNVERKFSLSAD